MTTSIQWSAIASVWYLAKMRDNVYYLFLIVKPFPRTITVKIYFSNIVSFTKLTYLFKTVISNGSSLIFEKYRTITVDINSNIIISLGVMYIWHLLWEGWGMSRGLANVLVVQSLFYFIFLLLLKKIGFAPWSDIMLRQTLRSRWQ